MKIISGSKTTPAADTELAAIAETVWVDGSHRIVAHSHDRAQLIHSLVGHLVVEVEDQAFLLTPETALWIPANVEHAVFAQDSVHYCSVFISVELTKGLNDEVRTPPSRVHRVYMRPLLQQLAISAATFSQAKELDAQQTRLLEVLVDQIGNIEPCDLVLSLPRDRRLNAIIPGLIAEPSLADDLTSIADKANVSARTVERIFKKETGYSYKQWQQRLILLRAIAMLKNGTAIKSIALELGYQTSSAFITMFKRIMKLTPSQYIKSLHP